jgi:hypothetical protein
MSIKPVAAVLFAALFITGCGGENPQEGSAGMQAASSQPSAPASAPATAPAPATIGDLFPEGEGRTMVLNNCSSCHAVACAAIGQRTQSRWAAIQSAHMDRLPGLSEPQMDTLFRYLVASFNDSLPEPNVPAAFLATGCTPQ